MNNLAKSNIFLLAVLILCGFALYFTPLQSKGFYFDDHFSVENNEAIKKIDIPAVFNAFNTRFLPGLSFALNYKLCGLHPEGYRIVNLLIHCLNAFLVYFLVKYTFYLVRGSSPFGPGMRAPFEWPALFASLLFLCHPIQTEPVNFVTQRFELMGTFFYLLTLFLYIHYRISAKRSFLIASMASAMAAMFCKEFVVTLPIMLTVYEFYFLGLFKKTTGQRCWYLMPFFVIVLMVPFLLLMTPKEAIGVANIADSSSIQEGDSLRVNSHRDITRAHGGVSRKQYFLTELNVVCTYVRLLFLPVDQNFDYDYPLAHGINKKTALCGSFLLCLLALAAVTYNPQRIVSFGVLWFFIALSVESSLIPIGHVIAEYRLYLASVGFVFLVTSLIYLRKGDVRKLNGIAAIILVICSILTFQRNKTWKDELTLWNDTIQKSPHKARPYYNRGHTYDDLGELDHALSDYTKAIELNPNYSEAYDNHGIIMAKQGNLYQAISDFSKTIELTPDNAKAFFNRGDAYSNQNAYSLAIADYTQAIKINPEYADAYNNRGNVYDDQGDLTQGLSDYTKAIEINPGFAQAYDNRGIDYCNKGNLPQAIDDFTKAVEINPGFAEAYNNRGYAYFKNKEYGKAWADINIARALGYTINPGFLNSLETASGRNN